MVIYLVALAVIHQNELYNLFYFLTTAFIFLSLIVVKGFVVSKDKLKIIKYYLFGLIPIKWQFHKSDEVIIKSDNSQYGSDVDIPETDNGNTGLGILFGCLFPIIARPKIGLINHSLQKVKRNGRMTMKVHIFLTVEEFQLAERFGHQKHDI